MVYHQHNHLYLTQQDQRLEQHLLVNTGSTGCGSRIISKLGTKVALNPVSVFILICGNSVNLPPLSTDTDLIFPKGSQLYERTVPLLGIISMVSTPQL